MLECVANVSEGRDMDALRTLALACGPSLIDVHADSDHHRSVFTLAGPGAREAVDGARRLAAAVAERLSIVGHQGEHPRLGALDVVPFVALGGTNAERAQAAHEAREFGRWWAEEFAVPVFCYDDADPDGRDLPHIRTHGFKLRAPDFGPPEPHPRLGATAVGARRLLIAVNCVLVARDVAVARRIARQLRERNGGMAGVRALGFFLPAANRAQVSMNLTDIDRTGLQDACLHVRELANRFGTDVAEVELVGLVPRRELDRCDDDFLRWSGIDATSAIEARVGRGPRWWPGDPAPVE
ncbi:MAG TPA: glutamate formiminotransferase [Acidimicrobiia bacterium]|nr:glutamate formiminotransferase [Acidimicrobiia bacterium]